MARPRDEFDLLLEAPHPVEAELARGMLADQGIPVFMHGGDFDVAELGAATHAMVRRPDVYVPRGMRERAMEALRAGGYETPIRSSVRVDRSESRTKLRRWTLAFMLFWLLVIPVLVLVLS